MKLDFMTLYLIILINSAGFALVWATVSLSYRSVIAARYWLASMIMNCITGPLLVEGSRMGMSIGVLFAVGSSCLIWLGVRSLDDREPRWGIVVAAIVISGMSMLLFGGTRRADNVVFAVAHIAPIFLTVGALFKFQKRSAGVWVAIIAGSIMIVGQVSESVTNLARIAGIMGDDAYYSVAAWFLVFAIIGASVLNLGFLLIVTDRLQAELYKLAVRDDLTGLPNRRAFRERIRFLEKSSRRTNRNVIIMMVDLDRFKDVNDRNGHDAGDAALVHLASRLRPLLSGSGFLARVGGDEFCVLLSDTSLEDATDLANRIVNEISGNPLLWRGRDIALAASIGLTEWTAESRTSLEDAIPLADSALFGSKRSGRSSFTVHDDAVIQAI